MGWTPARQRVRSNLAEGQGPDSPPRLPKQSGCPPVLTRNVACAGGVGPPLRTSLLGKSRPFTDGGGLCSLGRWSPSRRPQCNEVGEQCFRALDALLRKQVDPSKLLYELACGKHATTPFSQPLVEEAAATLCQIVRAHGAKLPVEEISERQPFKLAFIEEFLRLQGDPDFAAFFTGENSFAKGVRLGVDMELPRASAVLNEKVAWRQYDAEQSEFLVDSEWRKNYPTAKQNAAVLEKQFEAEEELGAMIRMDLQEAQSRYGDRLRLASLGAIQKSDDSFRIIHDGTHGTGVNSHIKVRDQQEVPSAGDLKQAMRELDGATFVFAADVKRAHRLVKVCEQDWGYQACRVSEQDGKVWLNCVGSFGIASAAIHWARLMCSVQRATIHLIGPKLLFMLSYVDDILWLAKGKEAKEAIAVVLLFLVAIGHPFSWCKCKGGLSTDWVGYNVDLRTRSVGISAKRARWLHDWCQKTLQEGSVKINDLRAVLGRMSFAISLRLNTCGHFWGQFTMGRGCSPCASSKITQGDHSDFALCA